MPENHHQVVVIGGGNAGPSVAGRLRRYGVADIVVIEPSADHYYKPIFSHITGGRARAGVAVRRQVDVMPRGVELVQDAATGISPDDHTVTLASGDAMTYDQLIVCPGIRNDWDAVPGLAAAMAAPEGGSNYDFELVRKTSLLLRDFRRGTAVFVQAPGPASCAGAGQKPMYLACDYWRAQGVLDDIRVVLLVPESTLFGIPEIDAELGRKVAEYGIEVRTQARLREVDAQARSVVVGYDGGAQEHLSYDLLHVEPPQVAPAWLRETPLPGPSTDGFIEVDPRTLRHPRFPDVWALGDAAATTNSKSGGALRKQTIALAKNLAAVLDGKEPSSSYDGYSVCPFTVSRSTVVFAEFDDHYRLQPTVPFWKGMYRESGAAWLFDRHILPWVYWHLILKGRA